MSRSFYLGTDAQLLNGAQNFASRIATEFGSLGLTSAQAADYQTASSNYGRAYETAITPATRTRGAVAAKDLTAKRLRDISASFAKIIDAQPNVTPEQKIDLGLAVRSAPTPIPVPQVVPLLEILGVRGNNVTGRVRNADTSRRSRPTGTKGAKIYSFVGSAPSDNIADWKFEGDTTKAEFLVEFPQSVAPFSKVWLTAQWINPRLQAGPACTPVATNLGSWIVQAPSAEQQQPTNGVKLAA
jgi:hypothetical protein